MNQITLTLSDNPDLSEYLAMKEIGDSCEMKVMAVLDRVSDDRAEMSIKAIKLKGKSDDDYDDAKSESKKKTGRDPVEVIFDEEEEGTDGY